MSKTYDLRISGRQQCSFGLEVFAATIECSTFDERQKKYKNIKRQISYNKVRKRQPFILIEYVEIVDY